LLGGSLLEDLLPRCRFRPGHLHCAVSGGADSVALLALAVVAAGPVGVTAWHVDHGLRPESGTEAARVKSIATQLGASFRSVSLQVEAGPNLEARARSARYEALPVGVCTGHTADDLAETVIANLLRGSGLDGLAPMLRSVSPVRPLLALRRVDTEAVCQFLGFTPLVDSMNADPRFVRVRVRHEVLPLLSSVAQRDLVPLLVRTAEVTSADVLLLDELAAALDATDAKGLAGAPEPLARRALRQWIVRTGVDPEGHPPSLATLDRMMRVARGEVIACEVGWGWRLARKNQLLRLEQTTDSS
jgi:tRNA(Ile)-lysidine synthase